MSKSFVRRGINRCQHLLYKEAGCQNKYDFNTAVTESITLYAKWTQNSPGTYTVTFNANGHGKAPASQTVENGAKATEPEDPEEEGYIFRAWYKEAECENRYSFNTEVTGDITLYAKWRKDESEDDDHDHDDSSNTNTANPDILSSYYIASPYNATVVKQAQGNLARLAFNAGMPAGYKEAFTYNMLVNGKADHSLKSGKFVLTIPVEYQKAGRKFALLGLDRTGKVLCLRIQTFQTVR